MSRVIDDPSFYAIAVPAVLLLGLSKSGFLTGFGSVATPLLALTMPVPQAAAIMLPLLLVMDATGVQKLWREADRALLKLLVPAGLLGIALGMASFRFLSVPTVSVITGAFTLLFLAQRRLGFTLRRVERSAYWGRAMATMSGFTSFIAHAGGPPMLVYALPLKLAPIVFAGTMSVFFATINLAKWVPYAMLGLFDVRNLLTSAVLVPLAPLGVWAGIWLTRRIDARSFYLVAELGMLVTGVKLIWDGWH
jgi:uncharacterized protein